MAACHALRRKWIRSDGVPPTEEDPGSSPTVRVLQAERTLMTRCGRDHERPATRAFADERFVQSRSAAGRAGCPWSGRIGAAHPPAAARWGLLRCRVQSRCWWCRRTAGRPRGRRSATAKNTASCTCAWASAWISRSIARYAWSSSMLFRPGIGALHVAHSAADNFDCGSSARFATSANSTRSTSVVNLRLPSTWRNARSTPSWRHSASSSQHRPERPGVGDASARRRPPRGHRRCHRARRGNG